jgi:hypothetical protein
MKAYQANQTGGKKVPLFICGFCSAEERAVGLS